MWEVKISYNKVWKEDGTVYRTCVRMNRELFNNFLTYLKDLYSIESTKSSYKKDWFKLWYLEDDINDYSNADIMYLRQTSTRALEDFFKLYNLNTNNRGLISNTFIKIQ